MSPPASSTEKRRKLDLPQGQLAALNEKMNDISGPQRWQNRIDDAGDDDSQWRGLFADVLVYLTIRLSITDLKTSILSPEDLDEESIVKGFNDDDLREWKVGVQKGVERERLDGLNCTSYVSFHIRNFDVLKTMRI
jgi:hypothetical protein